MITFLHGKLIEALPTQVVVDVSGIGYEALIPLSSFDKLPQPGGDVKLLTQLIVREDAHILYGFATASERNLFRLLIHSVSGIGPKTALNILSGISVTTFRGAVASSDVKALSQISGVGKKTAERIIVELRDKIGAAGAWEAASAKHGLSPDDQKINDAVLALMALGFKQGISRARRHRLIWRNIFGGGCDEIDEQSRPWETAQEPRRKSSLTGRSGAFFAFYCGG